MYFCGSLCSTQPNHPQIIFDTWLLSEKLPPDAYILGAISLYLDILNLLLYVIQLLAETRAREEQQQRRG